MKLTGGVAKYFDVYYHVHFEKPGWLDWAKNGELSGTSGIDYRLEGIQIQLVRKNKSGPGSTSDTFINKH